MHLPTTLLLAAVMAQGAAEERPDQFNSGGHSVATLDFPFIVYRNHFLQGPEPPVSVFLFPSATPGPLKPVLSDDPRAAGRVDRSGPHLH
jgi:hypothetical protein